MSDKSSRIPESKTVQQHLANERTFLAWVRTGIAMAGIGFLAAGFGFHSTTYDRIAHLLCHHHGNHFSLWWHCRHWLFSHCLPP